MRREEARNEALTSLLGTVGAVTGDHAQSYLFQSLSDSHNGLATNTAPNYSLTETKRIEESKEHIKQTSDQLQYDELESMDSDVLEQFVEPIRNALVNIDAEKMLALERTDGGARLAEG